jgi:hypothetical protein
MRAATISRTIVMPVAMMIASVLVCPTAARAAGEPAGAVAVPAEPGAQTSPGEPADPAAALSPAVSAPEAGPAPQTRDPTLVPLSLAPRTPSSTSAGGAKFGVGLRGRWVSVPSWLLGLFTKHNHPVSTLGHFGIEGFRRSGNFDLAVAFSYQNMSPPDGNWLGSGHDPTTDTRFLQFRGLSLYSADVSLIWHTMLTSWFGLHAGAGLGVALVRGDLFLFLSEGCTSTNLDDLSQCHPPQFSCANGVCTSPASLARVPSSDVLPVVPIVNTVLGVDFRLPDTQGWEAKLEAGFYDAFFAGFGVAYTF